MRAYKIKYLPPTVILNPTAAKQNFTVNKTHTVVILFPKVLEIGLVRTESVIFLGVTLSCFVYLS